MRNLFGTTALAVVIATSALAQTATQSTSLAQAPTVATSLAYLAKGDARDVHVSALIGATL